MTWIALLALGVYAALKSAQFAFVGRAAGYRDEPVGPGRRLRRGEPALLIVVVLVTMPPTLAATWYHRHKFEEMLFRSVRCYGLIQTYQEAPEIKGSNGEHAITSRSTAIARPRSTRRDSSDRTPRWRSSGSTRLRWH